MALPPITRSVEVACGQATAFDTFLDMGSWWPLARFTTSAMAGAPARDIEVERVEGGSIVEVGPDGSRVPWGTIDVYRPPALLGMDFHIPQPEEVVVERSRVEVRFLPLDTGRTRVELTQSRWEAFGERARDMQGGYGGGWDVILGEGFVARCEVVA